MGGFPDVGQANLKGEDGMTPLPPASGIAAGRSVWSQNANRRILWLAALSPRCLTCPKAEVAALPQQHLEEIGPLSAVPWHSHGAGLLSQKCDILLGSRHIP